MKRFLAALILMAGPAMAGTLGDGGAAKPEALGVLNGLYLGARLVVPGTETLAAEVAAGQEVALEVGVMTGEDAAPGKVELTCRVRFVGPDGKAGKPVSKGPCMTSSYEDLRSNWTLLPIGMTFRPRADDPAGVAGVEVLISDDTGRELVLMPSYDWQGGTE